MIIKKIQKSDSTQSNSFYAHALTSYIAQPDAMPMPGEDEDHKPNVEKCVYIETIGFSQDDLPPKEAAREMGTLCKSVDDGDTMNLINHWCQSWSKEDAPTQGQIIASAKEHLADQGYGPDHMAVIGIHADTDNIHVHIATCRVSVADGSILQEGNGWEKNEAQRACARAAHKYGWSAPGCKFVATGEIEKVQQTNKFTGEITERERPVVKKASERAEKPKALRDRSAWMELKTGVRSHQGVLQDTMHRLEITDSMKWGHVHKLAAEHGIEIKLADHGGRQGLVYSMDGERWEPGSAIGQEFTLASMEKRLGDKRFRHAKDPIHGIAKEVRKDMSETPTPAAEAKTPFSREQVKALRSIPVEEVRQRLGIEPTDSKKIRNGLDVIIHEEGMSYDQAVKRLAQKFPEVISGEGLINTVATDSYRARLAESGLPETLHRTAQDAMKQVDAFGVEKFHVYASGNGIGYTSKKQYPDGMTQPDLLKTLPQLAKMNIEHDAAIFFAPVHAENKISIPVDDVQQTLLDQHRPSLTFATSDRSRQAHYVIEKKYSDDFYDWLTRKVNQEYGDPKILKAGHDTRLAGFTNRKQLRTDGSGDYPFAKIEQHTPLRCTSFEQFVDEQYAEYKQQPQVELPKATTAPAQRQQTVDTENLAAVLEQQKQKEIWKNEKHAAAEYMQLQRVPVPAELTVEASSYQGAIRKQYNNIDAKRADAMIAKHLYAIGATRDQVYSWMCDNMTQDKDNRNGRDREARRTAVNLSQNSILKPVSSSDTHNALIEEKRAADSMTKWERQQMNAGNTPTPMQVSGNRDKSLAANAAIIAEAAEAKAAEEAKVKAEAQAKARAEAEQRQREAEERRRDAAKLKKWKAAAAKVQPKSYHSHSSQSSGPSSSHGPKM